jgi:hypothetical protein
VGDAGSAVGSPSELCAVNSVRRPRGLRAFLERLAFGVTVSRPSEWMCTFELDRFGVRVVGLSRAPPLTGASTPFYGVPSRFVRRRASGSPRNDPGLGISMGDTPGSRSSFPGQLNQTGRPCSSARPEDNGSFSRASLLGLSKISPPSTWLLRVHSRLNRSSTFGTGLPRPVLVPSLPFFLASTVFSAHQLAGLLRPAADHGVRHVSSGSFGSEVPHHCDGARFPARSIAV